MATKTVNNSVSIQSKNARNTVSRLASASVGKKKRETWTDGETESLLSHAIINKDSIAGSFSALVTKETRKQAWVLITECIVLEHPDCPPKLPDAVKKKFGNFEQKARQIIHNHKAGLSETGGGPSTAPLNPLYQKYWDEYLGIDNPCVTSTIEGAIDTEAVDELLTGQERDLIQHFLGREPNESHNTDLFQRTDESSEDNSQFLGEQSNDGDETGLSADDERGELRLSFDNALSNSTPEDSLTLRAPKNTQKRPSSAMAVYSGGRTTPAAESSLHSILNNSSKRNSKTLRETKKTTQFKLCTTSETAGHARMMETRLRLLSAAMEVRNKLNNPMTAAEIPKDLQDIIFDPYENI
ncbi:uncharacterized protein LOC124342178 [Daphnia pulicaria]|uniref:uncharacterized protein LOC124342178 n=1 Tax=Daphnia pulicaria TaxID=35523 RepID=UPI001EEB0598|nr:uncharacterized protein LOC124342178 [Daphnia pulicaria]